MVIIPGNDVQFATSSVFYEFRQDPNFYYLTGFLEPCAALVLYKGETKVVTRHQHHDLLENDLLENGSSSSSSSENGSSTSTSDISNSDMEKGTAGSGSGSGDMVNNTYNDMESIFFVPEKNAHAELWDGTRTGPNGAIEMFNADRAYPFSDIESQIERLLAKVDTVYMDTFEAKDTNRFHQFFKSHGSNVVKGSLAELFRKADDAAKSSKSSKSSSSSAKVDGSEAEESKKFIKDARRSSRKDYKSAVALVERSRLVKSEAEINTLRIATEMSSVVYNKAYATHFSSESQLQAFLDYEFRMQGCEESAYLPVVAGGIHALTIHYTRNNDLLRDGDLVLVDAGGRYGGYCADISRTWPVNGKFSQQQRDLYQAVLNVNKECITLCKADLGISLHDIHRRSEELMFTELKNAGFTSLSRRDVAVLYPHYIGHNLGLDVHDITQPPRYSKLLPGQVITIEPGVYVPNDDRFPKHFRGIGIRIEDDVVVGEHDYEVLTSDTLKEIDDIERAAAEGRQ